MKLSRCTICGDPAVRAKGRCSTCYQHWRRTGWNRTERHVVRLTERDIQKDLERQARRARGWSPNI